MTSQTRRADYTVYKLISESDGTSVGRLVVVFAGFGVSFRNSASALERGPTPGVAGPVGVVWGVGFPVPGAVMAGGPVMFRLAIGRRWRLVAGGVAVICIGVPVIMRAWRPVVVIVRGSIVVMMGGGSITVVMRWRTVVVMMCLRSVIVMVVWPVGVASVIRRRRGVMIWRPSVMVRRWAGFLILAQPKQSTHYTVFVSFAPIIRG